MLATDAIAMAQGIDGANPLEHDLAAFIRQQPNADISFIIAEHDPIYTPHLKASVRWLLETFAPHFHPNHLRIVMMSGLTHTWSTYYPQLYRAVMSEVLELPRTAYR